MISSSYLFESIYDPWSDYAINEITHQYAIQIRRKFIDTCYNIVFNFLWKVMLFQPTDSEQLLFFDQITDLESSRAAAIFDQA